MAEEARNAEARSYPISVGFIELIIAFIAALLVFTDYDALRPPLHDLFYQLPKEEPTCTRLRGPIGAEDAVLLTDGGLPVFIVGELDAGVHEFTNLEEHGTAASTSPSGTLWTVDRLDQPEPRLLALSVPLPDGVSLHTHGLGMIGDVLFAVNHAFEQGGERIERWRVVRTHSDSEDQPPVRLEHLGSVTGHDGAGGAGAWTFTSRLHGAINGVAPVDEHRFFFTQFEDGPVSLEGSGTAGGLEGFVPAEEGLVASTLRYMMRSLGADLFGAALLPRLRRARIYHCFCAEAALASGDNGGSDGRCERSRCGAIGPIGAKWNGIAFRAGADACEPRQDLRCLGKLYVNEIFRRLTVEFDVYLRVRQPDGRMDGSPFEEREADAVSLEERRTFRVPFLVDNVRVDASGTGLWLGGLSPTKAALFDGIAALQANASAAHAAARAARTATPRPHTHLRPDVDMPPRPAMPSGAMHVDLDSGEVSTRLVQSAHLASVSWAYEAAGKVFMGSPWDDGILVCATDNAGV